MVYYTGDFHGDVRELLSRFDSIILSERDIIVVLGDAGLNYFVNDCDSKVKSLLNRRGVQFLCIHGNHEMRPQSISSYHREAWHGGMVYVEEAYPNIKFAIDGEIYDLDGKRCITIGGAYSVDKFYRIAHGLKWFANEQPDSEIKARVEDRLEHEGWQIDIVLSHTCPTKHIPTEAFLSGIDQSTVDNSTEEWLDMLEDKLDYKLWLCGHWHINKRADKLYFLYKSVITTEEMGTDNGTL